MPEMLLDQALGILVELAESCAVTDEHHAALTKVRELQDKIDFTRNSGKWVNVHEPSDPDAKIAWSYYMKYTEHRW